MEYPAVTSADQAHTDLEDKLNIPTQRLQLTGSKGVSIRCPLKMNFPAETQPGAAAPPVVDFPQPDSPPVRAFLPATGQS